MYLVREKDIHDGITGAAIVLHSHEDCLRISVSRLMRKPSLKQFYAFKQLFDKINAEENLRQWLIPYFISSYPARKEEVYEIIIIFKRSTSMEALRYSSEFFPRT